MTKKRKLILVSVALAALVLAGGGGWWCWQAGVQRDRIVAALPSLPGFGAANAATREQIEKADAETRARFGGVKALSRLSRLYHANGFYGEALGCYEMLERLQPGEPRWFHRHASILSGYGDVEPAIKLWEHVLGLAPDYFVARLRIGDSQFKTGNRDAAGAAYEEVLKRSHDNPWALLGLARIDFDAKRWEAARERLDAVSRQTEGQIGADLLVTVYQRLGRLDLARETRGTAKTGGIYRDPPDPWIDELVEDCYDPYRISLASGVYSHSGQPERALKLLQRALEIAPNDVSCRFQLGTFHASRHEINLAAEQFLRCTQIAPEFADGWVWLSTMQQETGDTATADRTLADGLAHCPNSPGLHLMYARKLEEAERKSEAIGEYLNSIHLRPNEPDAYLRLGSLLIKLGRTEEGLQQIRAALATDPGFPLALSLMAFTSITAGDKTEARRWMQRVSEQPRIEPAQYERLGQAYREQFGEEWRPAPMEL